MNFQHVKERMREFDEAVIMWFIFLAYNPSLFFRLLVLSALLPLGVSLGWLWNQWNTGLVLSAVLSVIAALVNVLLLWLVARSLDRKDWCRRIQSLQIAFAVVLLLELFTVAVLIMAIDRHVGPLLEALWGIYLQVWNGLYPVMTLRLLKAFKPEK